MNDVGLKGKMTKKPRPKEGVRHQQYQPTIGTATSSDRGNMAFCPGRSRRHLRVLVGKSDATIHHPKRNYSGNGKDEQFV